MKEFKIKETDLVKIYSVNKRYTKESLVKLLKKNRFSLEGDFWVLEPNQWNQKISMLIGLFIQYGVIDMKAPK